MNKPFVYIASPYTKGDAAINTHFQCRVFDELLSCGRVWPYAPLLSHFQHTLFPRPYGDWVEYDNAIIPRMDACLRLDATHLSDDVDYHQHESSGADAEVELFKKLDKPVFYSVQELHKWARTWHEKQRATA
jgi:hypothetical protein